MSLSLKSNEVTVRIISSLQKNTSRQISKLVFRRVGEVSVRVAGALQFTSEVFNRRRQTAAENRKTFYMRTQYR